MCLRLAVVLESRKNRKPILLRKLPDIEQGQRGPQGQLKRTNMWNKKNTDTWHQNQFWSSRGGVRRWR